MKQTLALATKLLLLVSLILASMPSGATETVCVLGKGEVVRPVAKCGMPCCAKGKPVTPAPEKRSCCAPKKSTASVKPAPKVDPCLLAGKSCRCETRLIAAPLPRVATLDAKAFGSVEQPAVLPVVPQVEPSPSLLLFEPGIVGVDSGPPPKRLRSAKQPRAPPVSF